ncbi:MAG TPA: MFS transporter [Acidimicrobiales bacterium]|nr:MFS transporter [Acidimicrobiales bacterium]
MTRAFKHLLGNTLISGVTSSFLWFALIFWVYLETRSVVVTGVVGGAFSISSALLGPVFGTFVDRHRKRDAMVLATTVSTISFTAATAIFLTVEAADLLRLTSPWFWALTLVTLLGSVAGQLRSIPMSTCVTLLVADEVRDKANGLVGTITGLSFAITSVFSGLVIDTLGMGWAYYGALALTVGSLLHLQTIRIPEDEVVHSEDDAPTGMVDVRSAVTAIKAVPGLGMLIALAAFNNLLAGVFMALMDAYGLELVSVTTWGFLWGFISVFMIGGGMLVAKFGLGKVPLKAVLIGNLVNWAVCSVFAIQSSIVLLAVGMCVWLGLMPMIEAAEQTVLQRAIPYERQGRVFGFAQLVENAASPLTAFAIAPIAEAVFMPYMTDGGGVDLIGSWFGTGPERGIALMFTIAGIAGVVVTTIARLSRSYRALAVESMAPSGDAELAAA